MGSVSDLSPSLAAPPASPGSATFSLPASLVPCQQLSLLRSSLAAPQKTNMAGRRLQKEFAEMNSSPPDFVRDVELVGDNMFKWRLKLIAPEGTPYEKHMFQIELEIPSEYPFKRPELKFITKMYHPNIKQDTGAVRPEIFGEHSPQKIVDILALMRQALAEPGADSPLEAEIGALYKTDRKAYDSKAKEFTRKNAIAIK